MQLTQQLIFISLKRYWISIMRLIILSTNNHHPAYVFKHFLWEPLILHSQSALLKPGDCVLATTRDRAHDFALIAFFLCELERQLYSVIVHTKYSIFSLFR